MSLDGNQMLRLRRRPHGRLAEGDLEVVDAAIPEPAAGEVLVRNLWLSVDPSIRIRLAAATPPGYLPPVGLNEPLPGLALGAVVESRCDGFEVGDIVSHMHGFREYAVVGGAGSLGGYGALAKVRPGSLPLEWFLGPLGSSGLTAYAGLVGVLAVQPGDVVWVSAAAGAVGSIAAQLAKLRGCRVIGSAGGQQKLDYLTGELGLSDVFDYRSESIDEALRRLAPSGIDKYFDNVGAGHLTAAVGNLRHGGRIALCGAVSEYDGSTPDPGPSKLFQLVAKEASMQGFRAGSFLHLEAEMQAEIGAHLAEKRLSWRSTVFSGVAAAPAALVSMLNGSHVGKTLCRIE
ncbi:NADP-dependent oxidoreductase [Tomitella biformata]|uniref:NADP-dependent oxidoreductase n=1 Tax=Tomitella biformata TaxID=630403 RepID=UPI0004B2F84A|nr:NADP-dependent oxidoreductase [Tomitella biformata]